MCSGDLHRSACAKAQASVLRCIDPSIRFPRYVFRLNWSYLLFFDSDWVFCPEFADTVSALIEFESAECVCIQALDPVHSGMAGSYYFSAPACGKDYFAFLRGAGHRRGWLDYYDRYGVSSETQQWAIYCERNNEIAVIGIGGNRAVEEWPIEGLHAAPIGEALSRRISWGFTDAVLTKKWQDRLRDEYE